MMAAMLISIAREVQVLGSQGQIIGEAVDPERA